MEAGGKGKGIPVGGNHDLVKERRRGSENVDERIK